MDLTFYNYCCDKVFVELMFSGCPEAVKILVGNKCDLPADVDLSQAKVSLNPLYAWCYLYKSGIVVI